MNTQDTLTTKQNRVDFLKLARDKSFTRREIQRIKLERLLLAQKRSNPQDCPNCDSSLLVVEGFITIDDGSVDQGIINEIKLVEALIIECEEFMQNDESCYQTALDELTELLDGVVV